MFFQDFSVSKVGKAKKISVYVFLSYTEAVAF